MTKKTTLSLAMILFFLSPLCVFSNSDYRPFQLAIFNPIQVWDSHRSIVGLRTNLLLGINENLLGLDIGALNVIRGKVSGVQFGLFNNAGSNNLLYPPPLYRNDDENGLSGFQIGFANRAWNAMDGGQIGIINGADKARGIQAGIFNYSNSNDDHHGSLLQMGLVNVCNGYFNGFQIGLCNITGRLRGIQLGLINIDKDDGRRFKFVPIINVGFGFGLF